MDGISWIQGTGIVSRSGIALEALARLRRLKQAAGRAEARIEFALRGGVCQTPLSDAQLLQYRRAGYLLVSGLVPDPIARGAEAAMWRHLGADPQSPASWTLLGPRPHVLQDKCFAATYTEAMLAAARWDPGQAVVTNRTGFKGTAKYLSARFRGRGIPWSLLPGDGCAR
jgi:hypothetical protein